MIAYPMITLLVGMTVVIVLIAKVRMSAFLALLAAAIVVSLMAPGQMADKLTRVTEAFGGTASGIGIVIALAVVIGRCMMDSGAADRIVRKFLSLLGEKRASTALMASGFVLSIPVFFDTVFYLLVPLARSMYRRTGRHYLRYAMAIAAGGVVTHCLVPPTPGPLVMAQTLKVDIGTMILVGGLIAVPASIVGMAFAAWADKRMNIAMRPLGAGMTEAEPIPDAQLPGLAVSLMPIALPVVLVSLSTIVTGLAKVAPDNAVLRRSVEIVGIVGNVNLAMFISAVLAMMTLKSKRHLTNVELGKVVEESLMSGGVIILITAAGGAFGAMLKAAQVGPAIQSLVGGDGNPQVSGVMLLVLGMIVATVMKVAQGSGTVAMIAASGMIAAMVGPNAGLGFHPVYLAVAIGGGSMIGSWMNDSGFWIFVKMSGLTEAEGIKSWTPLLALVGLTSALTALLLSMILPMA